MVNGTVAEAGADIDAPRLSFPYFDNRPRLITAPLNPLVRAIPASVPRFPVSRG